MIEALACGVPVVAPASGGPTEIVTAACGRLYPAGDASVAARGVLECLERPSMRSGARARAASFSSADTQRAWRGVPSAAGRGGGGGARGGGGCAGLERGEASGA